LKSENQKGTNRGRERWRTTIIQNKEKKKVPWARVLIIVWLMELIKEEKKKEN